MIRKALILIIALYVAGCGFIAPSQSTGLRARLEGRGPVALSADNPFLVGNLVLAREMDQSPVLSGFIAHRGAPLALEIEKSAFAPYKLVLFYPSRSEEFTFEQADDDWIIDGPNQIDREKLKEVVLLTRQTSGEPKLLSKSELHPDEIASTPEPDTLSDEPAPTPTLSHGERLGFRSPIASPTPFATPRPAPTKAQISKEQMIAEIESAEPHLAEITAKGDLVHYVGYPGETLLLISQWYTYDRANAGKIARINGMTDPDQIAIGDTIIIPSYLVRNKNRLSQEGLDLVSRVATEDRSSVNSPD